MKEKKQIESLTFVRQRGEELETAYVVTDGNQVRTYRQLGCDNHETLSRAIARLEVQGFTILSGQFYTFN